MLLVILKMNFNRSNIVLMKNLPDSASRPRMVWDNLILVLTPKVERGLLTIPNVRFVSIKMRSSKMMARLESRWRSPHRTRPLRR